ncbi:NUDIX hydrolase [Curtobacterium sp. RRHDQ10]|uniref:NUDIX hydrolase n=1 Tax=Curtobacterium phyllosphaerae TaxID=3413379 RepID=UPI003BF02A8E
MALDFTDYDTRLGAYGVVVDEHDRVLLARWNAPSGDMWILPGGGVEFGETPEDGLVREFEEETGYDVECGTLLDVRTSTIPAEQRFVPTDRPMRVVQVFYTARITGGALRDEVDGSTDAAAWVPIADLPTIQHARNIEHALELAAAAAAARGGVRPRSD